MYHQNRKVGALVTAFAMAVAGGVPARAADPDGVVIRTATVSTHNLDLTTPKGQAGFHRRILLAAERACRVDDPSLIEVTGDDFNACVAHAVQGTREWATAEIARSEMIMFAGAKAPVDTIRLADKSVH